MSKNASLAYGLLSMLAGICLLFLAAHIDGMKHISAALRTASILSCVVLGGLLTFGVSFKLLGRVDRTD